MIRADEIFREVFKSALTKYNTLVPEYYSIPSHLCPFYACTRYVYRFEKNINAQRYSLYEQINGNSFDIPRMDPFRNLDIIQNDPELVYAAITELMEWQIALAQVRALIRVHVCMVRADKSLFTFRAYVDKAIEVLSDKALLMLLGQEEIDRVISALSKTRPDEPKLSINSSRNINKTGRQQFYGT